MWRVLLARVPSPWSTLPLLIAGSVFGLVGTVLTPVVTGKLVDALVTSNTSRFFEWALVLLGITVACVGVSVLTGYAASRVQLRIGHTLRRDLASTVLHSDVNPPAAGGPPDMGDLTARVTSDVGRLEGALEAVFLRSLGDCLTLALCFVLALRVSLPLALVAIVVPLLIGTAGHRVSHSLQLQTATVQAAVGGLLHAFGTWLSKRPWVAVFGIASVGTERIGEASDHLRSSQVRLAGRQAWLAVITAASGAFPQLLILGVGGAAVLKGTATIGDVVALLGLTTLVSPALGRLLLTFSATLPGLLPSFGRVAEVLARPPAESEVCRSSVECVEARQLNVVRGPNVVLSVPEFRANAGEVVGIKGPNGSGKSSLVLTLAGLLPGTGSLVIKGKGGEAIPASFGSVAVSPAEPLVFPGSVLQNVSLFGQSAVQVWRDSTTTLSGLDDQDAGALSFGQMMKVNVTRAVSSPRGVLLLDEPSGGLEPAARGELIAAIRHRAELGPVIVVSHDSDVLAACDKVYEVKQGPEGWQLLPCSPEKTQENGIARKELMHAN